MTELKYSFTQYTEDGEVLTKVTTVVPYRFFKSAAEDFCSCVSYDATTKCAVIRVPNNDKLIAKLDALWTADQEKFWAHRPVAGQVAMSLAPAAKTAHVAQSVKTVAKPAPVAVSVKSAAPVAQDNHMLFTKFHDSNSKVAYIGTRNGMKYKVTVRVADSKGNIVTLAQWFDKDQVAEAAELAHDIDTVFDEADIDFVKQSSWNGELNGTIMVIPF